MEGGTFAAADGSDDTGSFDEMLMLDSGVAKVDEYSERIHSPRSSELDEVDGGSFHVE